MQRLRQRVRRQLDRAHKRDRSLEGHVQTASRLLWPWQEYWLITLAGLVAVLDYTSTYAILEFSGKANVYEAGWLASWALRSGGFGMLLLTDFAAVAGISLAAVGIRSIYFKLNFRGYGRAAFVILLVPYVVVAFAAIVNNVVLTLL